MCLANRPALPSVGRAVRPSSVPIPVLIAHHSPTQPGVCATEAKDASHARSTLTCVLHSPVRRGRIRAFVPGAVGSLFGSLFRGTAVTRTHRGHI